MSRLLSWATDTLASVTSSAMAPFRGDAPPPTKAEVHVCGRPPTGKAALRAKKAAQAKRRAQQAAKRQERLAAEKETDAASDSEGGAKAAAGGVSGGEAGASAELDERTKLILERMAEAAEQRRQEELAAEAEEEERIRKRNEDLANSIVKEMPADPIQEERIEVLKTMKAMLKKIGSGEEFKKLDEFLQALPDKNREFEDLAAQVEQALKTMAKKTPRIPSDRADFTPEELREKIQTEELKETPNQLEIKSLFAALVAHISQANQKDFFSDMQDLLTDISGKKSAMLRNLDQARNDDSRVRALERLQILYETAPGDHKELQPQSVVGKNLNVDFGSISQFQRKIERKFMCVMTPPPRRAANNRTVKVWGLPDEVDELIDWVQECDWSGTHSKTYDRRVASMIVGRNGTTIQQLETETNTMLNLDAHNVLTVYGRPEDVETVWKKVEELKTDSRGNQQTTRTFNIDPRVGRALLALHRSEIQAMEDKYQCRINVWLQPNDDGPPRIFVRCPAEKQEEAFAEIQRCIVDGYSCLEFSASARAVSRMLIPLKTASATARATQIHNEFRTFQQDLGLFVQREAVTEAVDANEPVRGFIWVVCKTDNKPIVQSTIEQLIKKADYSTERISIMREQQRIFTAENRGLIEASSGGCRVSIVNNPTEGSLLMLVGSEESIEKGKQIVRDILEREGAVETVDLSSSAGGSAVVDYLLRDRAAVLRSMEDLHAVSIHLDRENNKARIVGDRLAIENAAKELSEIETEISRSQEDTIQLIVTIDADKVPLLIGRTGQTIQQIRSIPGVQSVEVPPAAANRDAAVVDIVLVGRPAALEEAQTFIEKVVDRSTSPAAPREPGNVDYGNRIGRGRGRRGNARREPDDGQRETKRVQHAPLHFEESAFPALGEVIAVDDA